MQIYTLECDGETFDKNRLFDIDYNIRCGILLFIKKVKLSEGDIIEGILRYNGAGDGAKRYLLGVTLKLIYMVDFESDYRKTKGEKNVRSK
jgi:hypothetical protein